MQSYDEFIKYLTENASNKNIKIFYNKDEDFEQFEKIINFLKNLKTKSQYSNEEELFEIIKKTHNELCILLINNCFIINNIYIKIYDKKNFHIIYMNKNSLQI